MFKNKKLVLPLVVAAVVGLVGLTTIGLVVWQWGNITDFFSDGNGIRTSNKEITTVKKFKSDSDFQEYISYYGSGYSGYGGGYGILTSTRAIAEEAVLDDDSINQLTEEGNGTKTSDERYSTTNVQVSGIDEPDIVKNDNENIFVSLEQYYYYEDCYCVDEKDCSCGSSGSEGTQVVSASDPKDMSVSSEIDEIGEMLLINDILVIFQNSGKEIIAYDVSDRANPEELWNLELEYNTYLVTARSYGEEIYIVTSTYFSSYNASCPMQVFSGEDEKLEVACTDIYRPDAVIPSNSTYTVSKINSSNGEVVDTSSFLGYSSMSTVYMSSEYIFVTYYYPGVMSEIMYDFIKANEDLFDSNVMSRVRKLMGYDLSEGAKMYEFGIIMEEFVASMSDDDRLKLENELENRMSDYIDENKRELEKTGIIKLDVKDLEVKDTGVVPGTILNQFSLDYYNGNLRVATTVGENLFWSWGSSGESVNDVYVLDDDMKKVGEILDMGEGERIYSARFIGDRGYIVTFRQTDPFYVLDLSDPKDPKKTGELKIPGYSSYLHPLGDNLILGVGMENWKVKLSLFDVSDASNPTEVSKYNLDDYYSDILSTHHAFLWDKENEYFFIPGSSGGYVFSYENDELKLEKAMSGAEVDRAVYIGDYLYLVSTYSQEISVYEIGSWEEVGGLDL